jgi:hypothetical protein
MIKDILKNFSNKKYIYKGVTTKYIIMDKQLKKTFKHGLGGGILGAFVGMPGLGMGLGIVNANKKEIIKQSKDFDKEFFGRKKW